MQMLNQQRAAACSVKKSPFALWKLNPNNRLRLGIPASSGGSATPQPWPVSGINVLDVRCQRCNQSIYGQYGSWAIEEDPTQPQEARDKLAKFFKLLERW